MSVPDPAKVQFARQKVRLIAAVMTASVVAVMVVLWLLTSNVLGGAERAPGEPFLDLGVPWLPALLLVVAAVLLVATPLLERRLLSGAAGDAGGASRFEAGSGHAALDRYVAVKVMTLALREGVGILGLLVGLIGDPMYGYALGAAALLALAFGWPRDEEIRATAR